MRRRAIHVVRVITFTATDECAYLWTRELGGICRRGARLLVLWCPGVKCALRCISFFPLGDYACGNSFSVRQSKSLKSYRRYVALPRSSPRKSNARDRARRTGAYGVLLISLISMASASRCSFPSLEYCFMKRTVFAAPLRELNRANRLGEDIAALGFMHQKRIAVVLYNLNHAGR